MIDRELRLIDSALAGAHRNYRFAAKGVASIESNSLIVSSIPVQGWHPIDASIRVGNIPALVKKLGGSQLYGDEPLIALRELIQNSCDAVRARRLLEERREDWGQVVISVDSNKENSYLRILDCGVGMSVEAITDGLLDFGNSYWNSELSRKELPTLASRGFKSTGKFGIGFFSVFMLGEDVKVQSRRYNAAAESATTLRFSDGVLNRPILTFGEVPELKDGGTLITVKLESSVAKRLLERNEDRTRPDLAARIVGVAPATDVTIILKGRGGVTLKANSWKSCSAGDLVRRAMEDKYIGDGMSRERLDEIISLNSEIVRDVLSSSGKLLGRGFVSIRKYDKYYNFDFGSAVVGGLVSGGLSGLGGIFLAETDVVTRDSARLTGDLSEYHGWLREQANLIKKQGISWDEGADLVETLLCAGLEDESVPALLAADGAITLAQFKERVERLDRFMLVQDASYSLICSQLVDNERISEELRLLDNVFVSKMGYRGVYVGDGHKEDAWGRLRHSGRSVDTLVASVGLKAWGISIAEEDIVNEKRQTGLRKNELVGHVGEREIFDSCYVYEKAAFNKHQRRKQG